jgi:hypothetical protein
MTLLSVVKDVCAVVGVAIPDAVIPSLIGNRTMQEMLALANEMAERIAYDNREWTGLQATATITGTGATTYSLPTDYRRMLKSSNIYTSTAPLQPLRFIPDPDEWLQRRLRNVSDRTEWHIQNRALEFYPALPIGTNARFMYLHKNCISLNSGGVGPAFLNDADTFLLSERVLKLGMIWQWKANKGAAYAEDLGTYGDALAFAQGADSPAPVVIGRRPLSANARTAYPWPVPT